MDQTNSRSSTHLFALDGSQGAGDVARPEFLSHVARRQARSTALAASHHLSSGVSDVHWKPSPPRLVGKSSMLKDRDLSDPLASMVRRAAVVPRTGGAESTAPAQEAAPDAALAMASAQASTATYSPAPLRRPSNAPGPLIASMRPSAASSHATTPLRRPEATPAVEPASAETASPAGSRRGLQLGSDGVSRSSSVPALPRGELARTGALRKSAVRELGGGGRASAMSSLHSTAPVPSTGVWSSRDMETKLYNAYTARLGNSSGRWSSRDAAPDPRPQQPLYTARPGAAYPAVAAAAPSPPAASPLPSSRLPGPFSVGPVSSMAELVGALMGKAPPEGQRRAAGSLSPALAPLVRAQHSDVVVGTRQTPGVARGGGLFIPSGGCIHVIDEEGLEGTRLLCDSLGLSDKTFAAACDPISRLVVAADCSGEGTIVSAFKPHLSSGAAVVRWCTTPGEVYNCFGLAILPKQELVVAASYHGHSLQVYRLLDGVLCATAAVREPTYLATDPETASVYVSSFEEDRGGRVLSYQWRGGLLHESGAVEAAGATDTRRPLAYVPPAPGKTCAHLVVGSQRSPTLLVVSLPTCRLVHTFELDGVQVIGLGCDAARPDDLTRHEGRRRRSSAAPVHEQSLVVLDHTTNDALVLRWPLPGMPELL